MIPISDRNPTRGFPITNLLLIATNVIIFLYELTLRSPVLDRLIFTWGVVPSNLLGAFSHPAQAPLSVWATLITSQFLHAGWAHILGNMIFLWVFGDNVEDILGSFPYLIFYLVCGVIAGIVQVLVIGPSDVPSIGASGAIAGVLGAYLLLYPLTKVTILLPIFFLFWGIDLPAVLVIGWWFVQQLFYGLGALSTAAASGIAFWAHIGGFAMGAFLILPYLRRARPRRRAVPFYDASDD